MQNHCTTSFYFYTMKNKNTFDSFDVEYFLKYTGISNLLDFDEVSLSELTERFYNEMELDNSDSITKWNLCSNYLERYLRSNFETFKETELVYKWGKSVCDSRTEYLIAKRRG